MFYEVDQKEWRDTFDFTTAISGFQTVSNRREHSFPPKKDVPLLPDIFRWKDQKTSFISFPILVNGKYSLSLKLFVNKELYLLGHCVGIL